MNDRTFLDTNVLIYAIHKDDPRADVAESLLSGSCVVSVQVLNEFVAVALRKLAMPWQQIFASLGILRTVCPNPLPVTTATHDKAVQIAFRYKYRIFDALLIASALESSCTTLYSEDMHDGQVIEGLTIRNPFRRSLI